MRRSLWLVCGIVAALALPASANAAITSVFDGDLACATQSGGATDGQRWCGATAGTTINSFDGTPIDVSVAFPPESANPADTDWPTIGIYHGWGGSKILPSSTDAQAWLQQGYAVVSITDRGWHGSCNKSQAALPACATGYVHLMHNAFEVRDAQTLLGYLVDDDVIDSQKIGATGGSYGGGMSSALAVLKDRIQLADGSYDDWESPLGESISLAAAMPNYTWSDLTAALLPNGSTYDYAAYSPYRGPNDDRRIGINKLHWTTSLYLGGVSLNAFYAPTSGPGFPDPAANMVGWYSTITSGGPYDGNPDAQSMADEIEANHGSYNVDNSTAPAPMLIGTGWYDDLFPANEAVRLYNKIRQDHPTTPVKLYGLDFGHSPRAANFAGDLGAFGVSQGQWAAQYVKGLPAGVTNPLGGVTLTSAACSGTSRVAGTVYTATSWANVAQGEVRVDSAAAQTVNPGTSPATPFTSGTVCSNSGSAANTSGAAVYTSDPAPTGGLTVAGSATVDATLKVNGANDQLSSRLYDYDPGADTEKLIGRGIYRPTGVGSTSRQTFQLFPVAYELPEGHVLKLELLSADQNFTQASPGQQPITVSDLTLKVPVLNDPDNSDEVTPLSGRTLPAGYTYAADAIAADTEAPVTADNVTGTTVGQPFAVTLSAEDRGLTGIAVTHYEVGTNPSATLASPIYDPNNKPKLNNGEKISYFSVDVAGNDESPKTSVAASVDTSAPAAPGGNAPGKTVGPDVMIPFTLAAGTTATCSVDGAPPTACASPLVLTGLAAGAHTVRIFQTNALGNTSAALEFSFTVTTKLSVTAKRKGSVKVGRTVSYTPTAALGSSKQTGVKYSYAWKSGKKTVGKKSKLKISRSMRGKKLTVTITATKSGLSAGKKTYTVSRKVK